ncbi:MAG: hypothetical protein M3401_15685 [Actinomycetota bacterium]|nr:hypothetical protein [Actinomycetota bacterium]
MSEKRRHQPQPLISPARRRDLDRIGREQYGGPYLVPGGQHLPPPPPVEPPGSTYLLEAVDLMGTTFPLPGSPEWTEFEHRICTELLEAAAEVGGWAIAGALYVATDLDTDSRSPLYLEIIDRASAFLHASGVPYDHIPNFVLQRQQR